MDLNKQTVKALLGVACGSIAFAAALLHLSTVAGAVVWLLGVLAPLLLGCAIAFILNVPMRGLERYLFPHAKKTEKLRRPLALVLLAVAVIMLFWPMIKNTIQRRKKVRVGGDSDGTN